jgi:CRISPR-associated exonuclease Cas4
MIYIYISVALLLLAIFILWQSSRQRKDAGLPGGRVIYTDTRAWGAPLEKPLYDSKLGLTGKPDYLVEQKGQIIPIEVKSGRAPESPYDSHLYQLAAYCLLVDKIYGKRPPYGIIHYPSRSFAVDYTPVLESTLLDLLAEMRRDDPRTEVDCSHDDPARCRRCGFRNVCEQKLA